MRARGTPTIEEFAKNIGVDAYAFDVASDCYILWPKQLGQMCVFLLLIFRFSEGEKLRFEDRIEKCKAVQIRGIFHVYPLKLLAFWTSFDRFCNQVSFFFFLWFHYAVQNKEGTELSMLPRKPQRQGIYGYYRVNHAPVFVMLSKIEGFLKPILDKNASGRYYLICLI